MTVNFARKQTRIPAATIDFALNFRDENWVGAGMGSFLLPKDASDDAQELEGAVGLRDVAVAT